jgi:VWFA-related protein
MYLRLRLLPIALLLAAAAAPALHAQKLQTAPPPPAAGASMPVFRSRTRIVILDVVVTDKKGNPVTSLKQSDFSVIEDKKPQTILSFEAPAAHVMPPAPDGKPVVTSAADLPKIGNAPVTILVLDELNTAFSDMAYARQSLQKYLNAQSPVLTQPTALLVVTNTKFQLLHDYTQDRASLLSALSKHFPEYPWRMAQSGRSGPGATERIAMSMSSLLQIAEATRGTPGRKNILWVGANPPGVDLVNADPETIKEMSGIMKRITQTLLEDRVTVNDIDPTINETSTVGAVVPDQSDDSGDSDAMVDFDPFSSDVSLQQLAPATGGQSLLSRNDINKEIGTTITDGNNYYTLSYSPTNSTENAAKFRNIKIVLSNPDLIATTRSGYYPESANANNMVADTSLDAKQRADELKLELSQAALSVLSYNGVVVTATRGPSKGNWLISVRTHDLSWSPQPDGKLRAEVTVMAVAFDALGTDRDKSGALIPGDMLGHVAHELESSRPADAPEPDNVVFQLPYNQPSATRRIRFIVRDATSAKLGIYDLLKP